MSNIYLGEVGNNKHYWCKMGNADFLVIKQGCFVEWVLKTYTVVEFKALSLEDKKRVFLYWKYGLSDKANEEADIADKEFYYRFKDYTDEDFSKMSKSDVVYIKMRLKYCEQMCKLWKKIENDTIFDDDFINEIKNTFNGNEAIETGGEDGDKNKKRKVRRRA